MKINEKNNKDIVWNVFLSNNKDDWRKLSRQYKKDLLIYFEGQCNKYEKQKYQMHKNINEINKLILSDCNVYLNSINYGNNYYNDNNIENLYGKKDSEFEIKLKQQQENFSKMINGNKPEEIDFSDKNTDSAIHNMDYLMNQTMADRENELKSITTKYNTDNKTLKWINNDNENNIVKLNIKDDVVDNNLITPIPIKKK